MFYYTKHQAIFKVQRSLEYLAWEGGRVKAIEWTPPSLGILCIFVSAVSATPINNHDAHQ